MLTSLIFLVPRISLCRIVYGLFFFFPQPFCNVYVPAVVQLETLGFVESNWSLNCDIEFCFSPTSINLKNIIFCANLLIKK